MWDKNNLSPLDDDYYAQKCELESASNPLDDDYCASKSYWKSINDPLSDDYNKYDNE